MKLSKSVGKGCYSTSRSDVLVVQTALANIKRANKPHYCGKLDGKDGPKTEAAIADFQSCNGIKATGKVESYGPTINKLRQKTPMSVKNRISGGIATPAAASNTDMAKVKAVATKTAKQITTKEPLPKVEAAALAKIVMDAAGVGVPLVYKATGISNDGRFVAEFEIASFAQIAHGGSGDHKTKMIQKVSQFVGKYATWGSGPSGTLVYKSLHPKTYLAGIRGVDKRFLEALEVKVPLTDKRLEQLYGAAEALMSGPLVSSKAMTFKDLANIIRPLDSDTSKKISNLASPDNNNFRFMRDAASWTMKQMVTNAASSDVRKLRATNDAAANLWDQITGGRGLLVNGLPVPLGAGVRWNMWIAMKTEVYAIFANLVRPRGIWDLKVQGPMKSRLGKHDYARFDPNTKRLWERDIWGNVHYGYIGLAAGFTRPELENGAGVAQLVTMARQLIRSNDPNIEPLVDGLDRMGRDFRAAALDPYNDNAAVRLGMDLWEAHGANLDFDTFSLEFLA